MSCHLIFVFCMILGSCTISMTNGKITHFHSSNGSRDKIQANCGYRSCSNIKDGVINVHLVPHSHDDTGWLKTVDQYYVGSNRAIFGDIQTSQRVGVQYVLDSVVKELIFGPNKR